MNDADVLSRKVAFLQKELIPLLQSLTATEKGRWGVMNGQQMVEHMIEMFQIANGQLAIPLFTSFI